MARSRRQAPIDDPRPMVVVCRGGDCGSRRKHPDFDHFCQLRRLQQLRSGASVIASPCLDACEHSNVIVVIPGDAGRAAGAETVWIGEALTEDLTEEVGEWVAQGGPGAATTPNLVLIQQFRPTRASRNELTEVRQTKSTARRTPRTS
jgi:hypothetical protein